MTTGTFSCIPTQQVLLARGQIKFSELVEKLMEIDHQRFRSISVVKEAITKYSPCLSINENDYVIYNKETKRYSNTGIASFEREIQAWLYASVPDMKKWELYPYKTPVNSKKCYMNIPWNEIPKDKSEEELPEKYKKGQNYKCDFRCGGEDGCKLRCGVSEEVLKQNGAIRYIGGEVWMEESELIELIGEEEVKKRLKELPVKWEMKREGIF